MDVEKKLNEYMKEADIKFDRIFKLMEQNGEHFSYFNKNLEDIKNSLNNHIKRVEPMLYSYERDTAFNQTLSEKGKKWGVRLTWAAGAIGSWYVLKSFVITLFK